MCFVFYLLLIVITRIKSKVILIKKTNSFWILRYVYIVLIRLSVAVHGCYCYKSFLIKTNCLYQKRNLISDCSLPPIKFKEYDLLTFPNSVILYIVLFSQKQNNCLCLTYHVIAVF